MTRSTVPKILFSLIALVCLGCIADPAFAQRGGGGGFHGGGGFRGGGGFSGGGSGGGFRGMPTPRGGGAFVRPSAPGGFRTYVNPGARSMRPGSQNGTGRAMVPWRAPRSPNSGGRWSTFAGRGNGSGSPGIRSGANGGAWRSFVVNREHIVGRGAASA